MPNHKAIVSCPSCTSRNHLSPAEASGLSTAECRDCGHRWREIETLEAIDITERASQHLSKNLPSVIDHDAEPLAEVRRLAELAREAKAQFDSEKAARSKKLRNWSIYAAFVLAPFLAAALVPETIVSAAPISYRAYKALGLDVNVYGLEIRRVERQHAIVDGARILTVKGEVSNVATGMRKMPWLHFTLVGPSGDELYTWTLDTGARPLRSGETTGFVTRVASPPELAQNIKIRFAKEGELGSNGGKTAQSPSLHLSLETQ